MKFTYYDDNDNEVVTEKLSDLQKLGRQPFFSGDTDYALYNYNVEDERETERHEELLDFLKDFYKNYHDCDTVVDALIQEEIDDFYNPYIFTYGFFVVKNDIIEKFITVEFAKGLYEGVYAASSDNRF